MNNSEKILKILSSFIENGVLSAQDTKNELITSLMFKRDFLIEKLRLVPKEEFEVLKKIVLKQEKEIKLLRKSKKIKRVKKS